MKNERYTSVQIYYKNKENVSLRRGYDFLKMLEVSKDITEYKKMSNKIIKCINQTNKNKNLKDFKHWTIILSTILTKEEFQLLLVMMTRVQDNNEVTDIIYVNSYVEPYEFK